MVELIKIRCKKCHREGWIEPILIWILDHPCGFENIEILKGGDRDDSRRM
jgi:hypothetical protein